MELIDPVVPSNDREVQEGLRLLESPINIFAETNAERRQRLQKLMIEGGYMTLEDIRTHQNTKSGDFTSLQHNKEENINGISYNNNNNNNNNNIVPVTSVRDKESFSQASPALIARRKEMLPLTLAKAEKRVAKLKETFLASPSLVVSSHHAVVDKLHRMRLTKSVRNVKMNSRNDISLSANNNNNNNNNSSSSLAGTLCMPFTTCATVPVFANTIITGAADGVMTLWDINKCLPITSVSTCDVGWGRVQHIVSHPTLPLIFSTSMFDRRIAMWNITGTLNNNNKDVENVDINHDNISLNRISLSEPKHNSRIHHLAIDPTGNILASTSDDSTIGLWDISTSMPIHQISHLLTQDGYEKAQGTIDISFHPDASLLATTDKSGRVVAWDIRSGLLAFHTSGKYGGHLNACTCVNWSPCGVRLASGGADHLIHLWDTRYIYRRNNNNNNNNNMGSSSEISPFILAGHDDVITSVQFYANTTFPVISSAIISTSLDGTIRIWDADRVGSCVQILNSAFPVWAQCCPVIDSDNNNNNNNNNVSAICTVGHSKYWSMWDVVGEGEEFTVIHKETEAIITNKAAAVTLLQIQKDQDGVSRDNEEEKGNSNEDNDDDDDDDDDDDEMMALRTKKNKSVSSVVSSDDDDEDEMSFLKKK